MLKSRFVFLMLLGAMLTFSSCGIFHKGCGCPTFGKAKGNIQMGGNARVYMC